MRNAFPLLDYEDPSIADTRKLLLKTFICPGMIRIEEGRKFLGLAMALDLKLLREAIIVVRNQIPSRTTLSSQPMLVSTAQGSVQ